ncbi:hypothetical protein D917_04158 [Trichinella nativa]|uniref:Uncharacterized protein n=1 Tax=Trichinella nativa TaxID=6335 RepID=A0A1Y3E6Q1_9BILA|nr:hypothetical protein D917_04158 [Trichinella nativa]
MLCICCSAFDKNGICKKPLFTLLVLLAGKNIDEKRTLKYGQLQSRAQHVRLFGAVGRFCRLFRHSVHHAVHVHPLVLCLRRGTKRCHEKGMLFDRFLFFEMQIVLFQFEYLNR